MAGLTRADVAGVSTPAELARSHRSAAARGRVARIPSRLRQLRTALESAERAMAGAPQFPPLQRSTEWLLDNAFIIANAIEQVREDLPRNFVRELPVVRAGIALEVRVLEIARARVEAHAGQVDIERLIAFINAYQAKSALTMGELWAFPAVLRLALLERLVAAARDAVTEAVGAPHPVDAEPPAAEVIASCITALRVVSTADWSSFFERVSRVHAVLLKDPAGVYGRMEFETRDSYRKVIERIARKVGRPEEDVAKAVLERCSAWPEHDRKAHVGYHLAGLERAGLVDELGRRRRSSRHIAQRIRRRAPIAYALFDTVLAIALTGLVVRAVVPVANAWTLGLVAALCIVPSFSVVMVTVDTLLKRLVRPRLLPKLDLAGGVPRESRTVVAVPVLLTDAAEVKNHLRQLEINQRGNSDRRIAFALLADFGDADTAVHPSDSSLLRLAVNGIRRLNARASKRAGGPFLLLHRPRRWNPVQNRWMGWERKRGKLAQLNRRLLGEDNELALLEGDHTLLDGVRFVITLDADTFLPPSSARRLIGTLAHPLNRAAFDRRGRVVEGYTVLQPRVETTPTTARASLFARVFEGDHGLDLYTHAISDVYQDVFGEGVYAGKGIYEVAPFERSLEGRVPDNALLSHDLFEGVHGRAGFVSDITVFEDYPDHVLAFLRRLHRWVRGDWQIAPWLLPRVPDAKGGRRRNTLSLLDRWKIADNLRRSLLVPSLFALLASAWLALPESALAWTVLVLTVPALPIVAGEVVRIRVRRRRPSHRVRFNTGSRAPLGLARWGLSVALLPYRAYVEIDAVVRTLDRVIRSRSQLLEWVSAAHVTRSLHADRALRSFWRSMAMAPVVATALAATMVWIRPGNLFIALPVLAAWAVSPLAAWLTSRPQLTVTESLSADDRARLRPIARRTWAFFERHVGPDDHWLPPDNVQESPVATVAHRTSPTNIGLMLLSAWAAYDLGYISLPRLVALLDNVLDNLEELERFRGHFLNWHDTRSRRPLVPRYVSTVDSGNLAAALMVVGAGCRAARYQSIDPRTYVAGLADAWRVLDEVTATLGTRGDRQLRAIRRGLRECIDEIDRAAQQPSVAASHLFDRAGLAFEEIERQLVDWLDVAERPPDARSVRELRVWLDQIRQHTRVARDELAAYLPWLGPAPAPGADAAAFPQTLPAAPQLNRIPGICSRAAAHLIGPAERVPAYRAGLAARIGELRSAAAAAERLIADLGTVAARADALVTRMDFRFLFDATRKLFHLGYDVDAGRLDSGFYDLLASEARLTSQVAIAKGDVPTDHWLHLGRPFGNERGRGVLLSWGGTLFEYLLPTLLQPTPDASIVDTACRTAIDAQIRFARSLDLPWGMSESGYGQTDALGTYQYRAFGVPGLALTRDPASRLVIAPYASALALRFRPRAAADNLTAIQRAGAYGGLGFYEALDFSSVPDSAEPVVVRAYMAHHQGMMLVALSNLLAGDAMVRRFRQHSAIATTDYLLHEESPGRVRIDPRPIPPPSLERESAPASVKPWKIPSRRIETQYLSNGRLAAIVRSDGTGQLRWRDLDVTRWRLDRTMPRWGIWTYLVDAGTGALWSATGAPVPSEEPTEVTVAPHAVEFHRREHDVTTRLGVCVAAAADLEVRRLTLVNESESARRIVAVSYGEAAMARHADDRRHPAFQKLFVETEYREHLPGIVLRRRTESAGQWDLVAAHAVIAPDRSARIVGWETDRARFLGRRGAAARPVALSNGVALSGTTGCTLDPIYSLACEARLGPFESADIAFATAVAATESEALSALEQYASPALAAWVFDQARLRSEFEMHRCGLLPEDALATQQIADALLGGTPGVPGGPQGWTRPIQQHLWSVGVSGDHPLVLLQTVGTFNRTAIEQVIRAWVFLRRHGLLADLVVLDEQAGGYAEPLRDWLHGYLGELDAISWLNQPGGLHYVPAVRTDAETRRALRAASRARVDVHAATPAGVIRGDAEEPTRLPPFVPVPTSPVVTRETPELACEEPLDFDNGIGGFTTDGTEYVIRLREDAGPPAPWANVVSGDDAGFLVTESGGGYTWWRNSAESRLTPWSNDPVLDPAAEIVYARDEETGEIWSLTPQPAGPATVFEVRHGAGYSSFAHNSHGLAQRMRTFLAASDPARYFEVEIRDLWDRPRRITLTLFVDWALGPDPEITSRFVVTELDSHLGGVIAHQEFAAGGPVAWLGSSESTHCATADRAEFLAGPGGSERPAGLGRIGLAGSFGRGLDPCGALQIHIDLPAGEARTVHFALGGAPDSATARKAMQRLRDPAAAAAAWEATRKLWNGRLDRIRVRTPEPAMDVMLNRWLPYQALSSRILGRTGFYQSSGALGFRDQIQDVLAFLTESADLARDHLLEAAARQFTEGDVLHWWQPSSCRGVRTRCSDDLVWMPWATIEYVRATGDREVLDVNVPFLEGEPLGPADTDRYAEYGRSTEEAPLYEHCLRALDRASSHGSHGLPLIGSGDWNDALNLLGANGSGESVWLAWFLSLALGQFADLCDQSGDVQRARLLRDRARNYRSTADASSWDGKWYRRAYTDEGAAIGSAAGTEAQIDSLTQSWAVFALGDTERTRSAMAAVRERLVGADDGVMRLLDPPFRETRPSPGYIQAYPPGVRENGGQYTHAAAWAAAAFAALGDGDEAARIFRLLNPINRTLSPAATGRYRVEPYVVAADVYGEPPHTGRGGWTWYTGSAGWLRRLGLESILGFRRRGAAIAIDPVIPRDWPGFRIDCRFGETTYRLVVDNPARTGSGVVDCSLDGEPADAAGIPILDDGSAHQVRVTLGTPPRRQAERTGRTGPAPASRITSRE